MNAFEESVGYRSLMLTGWPTKKIIRTLSSDALGKLAEDCFDAELAEILRDPGTWHWELDDEQIGDIASNVAGHLSLDQKGWDGLYGFLREHYCEHYRAPTKEELEREGLPPIQEEEWLERKDDGNKDA